MVSLHFYVGIIVILLHFYEGMWWFHVEDTGVVGTLGMLGFYCLTQIRNGKKIGVFHVLDNTKGLSS